jgi:hypothetical protein
MNSAACQQPSPRTAVFMSSANIGGDMMKKLFVAAALLVSASPVFAAEFYIVQNPTTKRCTIVEQRPAPSAGIVIGDHFGVRVEAETRMKTVEVCKEGTVGGPGVRIEERERIRER